MIAQATLEQILPQLPAICKFLRVNEGAAFSDGPSYGCRVNVGDMVGGQTAFELDFDIGGKLQKVRMKYWTLDGDLDFREWGFTLNRWGAIIWIWDPSLPWSGVGSTTPGFHLQE